MFITVGYLGNQQTNNTEIVDLNGNCNASLPDYPMKLGGGSGVYYNNSIVIFGGYTNKSYHLQKGGSSFEVFAIIDTDRMSGHAAVVFEGEEEKIWLTGGSSHSDYLYTTLFIDSNGNTTPGPYLPKPSIFHTVISINKTTSYLIGGMKEYGIYTTNSRLSAAYLNIHKQALPRGSK